MKKDEINLLISTFDRTHTRMTDICTLYGVQGQSFESLRFEIYNTLTKWVSKRTIDFATCEILWVRKEQEGFEWVKFGPGIAATSVNLYTRIYTYFNVQGTKPLITLNRHVE